ncbi:hypothetical protein AA0113_g11794 [Alternaria arborescens]|uniref:Uncharacterized protein n=1 Tax=Alternaria arborescens TaxID=156630 RepID=A0A4Q4Q1V3_9PLEO|nr:hypothetical protein AA0113_g11794 [Alternaria arborescens]
MAWPDEELVKAVKAVLKTGASRSHLDPVATGLLEEIAITRGDGLLAWTRREASSTEAKDAQHLSGIPDLDLIDSDEEVDEEDDS